MTLAFASFLLYYRAWAQLCELNLAFDDAPLPPAGRDRAPNASGVEDNDKQPCGAEADGSSPPRIERASIVEVTLTGTIRAIRHSIATIVCLQGLVRRGECGAHGN